MFLIKRLIVEIHRRSLWQVLLVYLGAAWVVLELVDQVAERVQLAPSAYGHAFAHLLAGLLIVPATGVVPVGGPGAYVREKPREQMYGRSCWPEATRQFRCPARPCAVR